LTEGRAVAGPSKNMFGSMKRRSARDWHLLTGPDYRRYLVWVCASREFRRGLGAVPCGWGNVGMNVAIFG